MNGRPTLAQLLARRTTLEPGEVVTLLVPLARELAEMHASGRVHGAITAADVLLGAEGRATFGSVAIDAADMEPLDDVRALAALGWQALTGRTVDRPGAAPETAPAALADTLLSAVFEDGGECPDADGFADAVLRSCPAAPIRVALDSRPTAPAPPPQRTGAAVRPRIWLVAAGAVALAAAVVGGAAWGRHGEDQPATIARAPAPRLTPTEPHPSPVDWTTLLTRIERSRAVAFVDGDLGRLRAVYAPGSRIGRRDVATLRALLANRLRVRRLHASVVAVDLLSSSSTAARCRVVDAMSSFVVVDGRGAVVRRGAATRTTTETIRLARAAGRWRIVDVTPMR